MSYRLKLPLSMRRLHLVFYVVKLTTTPKKPILGQHFLSLLSPIVMNGEEEWKVERALNSY